MNLIKFEKRRRLLFTMNNNDDVNDDVNGNGNGNDNGEVTLR